MTTTTDMIHDLAAREAKPENPRRNGKIARLPKETRDMINHMLDDGLPARVIIDELGDAGRGLNAQNITNWVHGGYQDYLQHQDALARAKIQAECVAELLRETGQTDPAAIHRACQVVAGTQLLAALQDHGDQALANMLQREPKRYLPMLNTLCSMSRADLKLQKQQDKRQFDTTLAAMRASAKLPISSPIKPNQAPNSNDSETEIPAEATSTAESSSIKVNQALALPTETDPQSKIPNQKSRLRPNRTLKMCFPASKTGHISKETADPCPLKVRSLPSNRKSKIKNQKFPKNVPYHHGNRVVTS